MTRNDQAADGGVPGHEALLTIVMDVVAETIDGGRAAIGPNTALFSSDERFDSFAMLQLVLRLEKRFRLSIPDEDLDRDVFSSPQSIAGYLMKRLSTQA